MSHQSSLCSLCRRQVSKASGLKFCNVCAQANDDVSNSEINGEDVSYILPNDLDKLITENNFDLNKTLSMIHFNCRSLRKNFDSLLSVLASISFPFSYKRLYIHLRKISA